MYIARIVFYMAKIIVNRKELYYERKIAVHQAASHGPFKRRKKLKVLDEIRIEFLGKKVSSPRF